MKKIMKKKYLRVLLLTVSLGLLLSQTNILSNLAKNRSTAFAVGDLAIDWGVPSGEPIFVINNFLPGEKETREVKITNSATVVRPIGIRGIKTTETGDLSQTLEFIISQNGTDLYGGASPTGPKTLSQFFQESESLEAIHLSNINPGESVDYTFQVIFAPDSGNEFQGESIVFDLEIGIAITIPEECQGIKFSGPPIFGTQGNDNLKGTNGNDLIFGFEGDDKINGGNGDDCLIGGPGNDRLNGSNGNDVIFGDEGDDRIDGSNGDDLLFGGSGNDTIDASNGNDRVEGGDGNDKIFGGNGDDTIYGGAGNDIIDAGNGNDFVDGGSGDDKLTGKNGKDTLIGGDGNDWIDGGLGVDTCEAEIKKNCEK